jgi:hypothetical protein
VTETPPPRRRPSRRRLLGIAATLLVVVALGWTLIDGWSTVMEHDWHIRPRWLVGGALVQAIAYRLAATAYARVVAELHPASRTAQAALRRHWAVALLGRYVPGNVLMVAARLELGHAAGVARSVSLTASVYEQVLMLSASAIGAATFVPCMGNSVAEGRSGWWPPYRCCPSACTPGSCGASADACWAASAGRR